MNGHDSETNGNTRRDRKAATADSQSRSLAEWVTLGVSASIVIAMLGLITWLEFSGSSEPPRITALANLEQMRQDEGVFYVPVTIENTGDRTVEDVVIEAQLDTGDGEPEVAEITVTFLAGGERVHGAFVFTSNPNNGDLVIRPVSYKDP